MPADSVPSGAVVVACFLWFDPQGMRNDVYVYGPDDVHTLKRMVARHLSVPHRFVCVSDRPIEGVETVPIDWAKHVPATRFVKLMLFRPDIAATLGERILYLDLDCVVVGSLDPLVEREEDLVLWRNPNFGIPRRARYNTSIMLLKAGSRPQLWSRFDPQASPGQLAKSWGGTDQAWVSAMVSAGEAHWTGMDGVYGAGSMGETLPDNARIVFFPGKRTPDMASVRERHPWIAEHRC